MVAVSRGRDDQVRCGEGEGPQAHVFAVADDGSNAARALRGAFTFARHVWTAEFNALVVLNRQVLFAGNVERL